jgi:hypothetical protein
MRQDALAMMLHRANIHAGQRVVVLDSIQGLLTAAVLERLGGAFVFRLFVFVIFVPFSLMSHVVSWTGQGMCLQLHAGSQKSDLLLDNVALSDTELAPLHFFPLDLLDLTQDLTAPLLTTDMDVDAPGADGEKPAMCVLCYVLLCFICCLALCVFCVVFSPCKTDCRSADHAQRRQAALERRQATLARQQPAREALTAGNFDALVVAVKFHPQTLLEAVLPLLGRSRCLAVYSQQSEPLVDLYLGLKRNGIVGVNIAETWTREYQVRSVARGSDGVVV